MDSTSLEESSDGDYLSGALDMTVSPEQAKKNTNNFLIGIALAGGVVCLLCVCVFAVFNPFDVIDTPEEYAEEYDGDVAVYRQILSSNDCAFLQDQFDTAYNNNQNSEPGTIHYKRSLGFMTAADARMKELGCYD